MTGVFCAGMLTVTESQLGAVSALGAGLLVGTALAVVLPEGFDALHAVHESAGAGRLVRRCYRANCEFALGAGLLVGTALPGAAAGGRLTRCMHCRSIQASGPLCKTQ